MFVIEPCFPSLFVFGRVRSTIGGRLVWRRWEGIGTDTEVVTLASVDGVVVVREGVLVAGI